MTTRQFCIFIALSLFGLSAGAQSWTAQTTTGTPGNNDYSAAGAWNRWQQGVMGWQQRAGQGNNIYSDTLQLLNGLAYTKLADNGAADVVNRGAADRSEEQTSELQSLRHLVCRLLLEKKKK